jgi:hypothetical protein
LFRVCHYQGETPIAAAKLPFKHFVFQIFKNNELGETMLVKRNKFLNPEKLLEMKKFVGEDTSFPTEFDAIDENSVGKLSFSDLADWVLQKSLEIEIGKNKKEEGVEENDNLHLHLHHLTFEIPSCDWLMRFI